MKETKVIISFSSCGRKYFSNNHPDDISILNAPCSDFIITKRKRTEEELEEKRKEWDETPHLLSGEGYIDRIRDNTIMVKTPEYPNNYLQYISEHIGKVDYILTTASDDIKKKLIEMGIRPILVYPDKSLKEEWIGRMFLAGNREPVLKTFAENWDKWIDAMQKFGKEYDLDEYVLEHNGYLSDVINILHSFHS